MSLTNCRFYEEKFPEIDSFVMVNVRQIAEMGAYVKLLEYDDIDGMILLSELSRRRIRSIQKLIRVGRNEVVVVLRVDKDKGYIDLSKRRVSPEDISRCEERYNKSKMVHSILRHVAEKTHVPIEDLYTSIGWPLNKKYGHAVDAFKLSITNPDVWNEVTFESDAVKEEIKGYIGRRLTPQPTKVRSDVEVTCFGYEGIDAVKNALREAEKIHGPGIPMAVAEGAHAKSMGPSGAAQGAVSQSEKEENAGDVASEKLDAGGKDKEGNPLPTITEMAPVKVKLVSPPLYVLTAQCLDKSAGIATLERAIQAIEKSIRAAGGSCSVRMAPKAVTESDDAELAALMEKRERENAEISGDEDVSGSDEGEGVA